MGTDQDHKFIVRADFYGMITTNETTSFWLPKIRGVLYFDDTFMHFRGRNEDNDTYKIEFNKIIKVKMQTLNPAKNKWCCSTAGSPYYLLFWNPFWNRYLLNVTFFDKQGSPQEMFLKLKTKEHTLATINLLKKSMTFHKQK